LCFRTVMRIWESCGQEELEGVVVGD